MYGLTSFFPTLFFLLALLHRPQVRTSPHDCTEIHPFRWIRLERFELGVRAMILNITSVLSNLPAPPPSLPRILDAQFIDMARLRSLGVNRRSRAL